jgi:probable HAF family extracellular repeat protein
MALIGFGSCRFLILLLAITVFLKLNSLANARPIDSAYSITNVASPPSIGVAWTGQDAAGEWLGSEFMAEPTSLARQPITWENGRVRNGSGANTSQIVIIDNGGNRTQVPAAMPNTTMTPIAINNSGHVLGTFESPATNAGHAFPYSGGKTIDLGALQNSPDLWNMPTAVSSNGIVVGTSSTDESVSPRLCGHRESSMAVRSGNTAIPWAKGTGHRDGVFRSAGSPGFSTRDNSRVPRSPARFARPDRELARSQAFPRPCA